MDIPAFQQTGAKSSSAFYFYCFAHFYGTGCITHAPSHTHAHTHWDWGPGVFGIHSFCRRFGEGGDLRVEIMMCINDLLYVGDDPLPRGRQLEIWMDGAERGGAGEDLLQTRSS